ncbi:MAG: hypothetical protein BGO16_16895 [Nitrobacter sp. 62-23]|nr:MAG: hypothetical protein BGO16_16895 [Nitrobacter sp. 62-23]
MAIARSVAINRSTIRGMTTSADLAAWPLSRPEGCGPSGASRSCSPQSVGLRIDRYPKAIVLVAASRIA